MKIILLVLPLTPQHPREDLMKQLLERSVRRKIKPSGGVGGGGGREETDREAKTTPRWSETVTTNLGTGNKSFWKEFFSSYSSDWIWRECMSMRDRGL
jgi:hypothetical protein